MKKIFTFVVIFSHSEIDHKVITCFSLNKAARIQTDRTTIFLDAFKHQSLQMILIKKY